MMIRHFLMIFVVLAVLIVYVYLFSHLFHQSPSTPPAQTTSAQPSDSKSLPEVTPTMMVNEQITTQTDKTKALDSQATQPLLKESIPLSEGETSQGQIPDEIPEEEISEGEISEGEISEGEISSLTPEMVVSRRQPLSGSIVNFDANQHYFLIIQSQHYGQIHYPQRELVSADWETTGIYGSVNQKYGYRYDTFVVQTTAAEATEIMTEAIRKGKGLAQLPPDATIITEKVTVICCQ